MILECTECRSRYLVPDSAIGGEGRTVRCANCKHSWFQQPAMATTSGRFVDSAVSEVAMPPVGAMPSSASTGRDYDAYAHSPPFRPRRNPAKRWTAIALCAGVAMLAGVGAVVYTGTPTIARQIGFPMQEANTPLQLVNNPIERRMMSSNNELFAISGRVTNPTAQQQSVPDIRADLRDAQGKLVYSWTITPPVRTLGPKGDVEFNSAKLDVPANSKVLELSFTSGI